MIARAPYLFLLLVILPDVYLDLHYWRHRFTATRRIAYWIPTAILVGLTLKLTYEPEFIPDNTTLLYTYLLMIGLITAPKWAYVLCSAIGLATSKLVRLIKGKHRRKKPKNYGNLVGAIATVLIWYVVLYGAYIGFEKLEINHQTYSSPELPKEFDGYKIVLFSDAHVGTLKGDRQWMLKRAVDTMNAQNADMIIFTGDLQNVKPQEIVEHTELLGSLKAKDGVYSILGNHDYDKYMSQFQAGMEKYQEGMERYRSAMEKAQGRLEKAQGALSGFSDGQTHVYSFSSSSKTDGESWMKKLLFYVNKVQENGNRYLYLSKLYELCKDTEGLDQTDLKIGMQQLASVYKQLKAKNKLKENELLFLESMVDLLQSKIKN